MVNEFFMPMLPPTKTHQEKQVRVVNGKPVFYEPPELKEVRAKLESHLTPYCPDKQYEEALRLIVKWCFPARNKHDNGKYRITKPDTDNLNKMLKDVMTSLHFWKDDCLVVSEVIEKFWSNTPGIFIRIETLEDR